MNSSNALVSITVVEAQDDSNGVQSGRAWVPRSSDTHSLLSTNAPHQASEIYYMASLIPPLIAAVLEFVDLDPRSGSRIEVLHRFHRLLGLIVKTKPDAYLDILEVAAYHTPRARYLAIVILETFWPKAVGHVTVCSSFPISSYSDTMDAKPKLHPVKDHPYAHQFVPWRFKPHPGLPGGPIQDCRACTKPLSAFGLLCPGCMCGVHFDCYDDPDGSQMVPYSMDTDHNVQKLASFRFSLVLPGRRDEAPDMLLKHGHVFRAVNIFTLCLCCVCRTPLWGCIMQGLRCMSCVQFAHSHCLAHGTDVDLPQCKGSATTINSSHMTIEWSALRQSCVDFYRDILCLTKEELKVRSYEEISIFSAVLWTELQIMRSGVALGSIVIMQGGKNAAHAKEHRVHDFELHRVLNWCEEHLSTGVVTLSSGMDDYLRENRAEPSKHSLFFDWSNLVYISSTIKTPHPIPTPSAFGTSTDLLNVTLPRDQTSEYATHPFEVVGLSHMRDALGFELSIRSECAAQLILSHLHHLGFFDRIDGKPVLFNDGMFNGHLYCTFPLPLGLDLSTDVETLVASVEASLEDLHLSVNEVGFLLLVRKMWPNGMTSEYAIRRLARTVISWVLSEVTGPSLHHADIN